MARSRRTYRRSTSQRAASLLALALPAPMQRVADTRLGPALMLLGIPAMLVGGLLNINWEGGQPQLTIDRARAAELKQEFQRFDTPGALGQIRDNVTGLWQTAQNASNQANGQGHGLGYGYPAQNALPHAAAVGSQTSFPSTTPYRNGSVISPSASAAVDYGRYQTNLPTHSQSTHATYQQPYQSQYGQPASTTHYPSQQYSTQQYSTQPYSSPQYSSPQYNQQYANQPYANQPYASSQYSQPPYSNPAYSAQPQSVQQSPTYGGQQYTSTYANTNLGAAAGYTQQLPNTGWSASSGLPTTQFPNQPGYQPQYAAPTSQPAYGYSYGAGSNLPSLPATTPSTYSQSTAPAANTRGRY